MLRSRVARALALAGVIACLAFPLPAQAHVGTGAVATDPDVTQLQAAALAASGEPGAAGVATPTSHCSATAATTSCTMT